MKIIEKILTNRSKILGLNERQLDYIRKNNLKPAIRIADDKILTKKYLKKAGIPVPQKIAEIKNVKELNNFDYNSLPNTFVIKPVTGVRGGGIDIFYNKDKEGRFIRSDRSKASIEDIKTHARDILDGKYSLFNEPDRVLIEERIRPHKNFKYYTFKGTPDIRVIVYNKIPIMSYIRIPTKESDGKANLDLGAIGAGIDIAVGKTTNAIIGKSKPIEYVPSTGLSLSGIRIPFWDKILRYAIETSMATSLGYGAIDFLIDQEKGPVVVEINARPGLSIQLANNDGLKWRLKKAKGLKVKSIEHGIRIGKTLFGGEIEEEIEQISGKRVIGLIQNISLYSLDGKIKESVKAKIDTGADSSSIDLSLAEKLGYTDIIEALEAYELNKNDISFEEARKLMRTLNKEITPKFEYLRDISLIKSSHGISLRPTVKITIEIEGYKFETYGNIYDRKKLNFKVIIGRKSLNNFLLDPSKK